LVSLLFRIIIIKNPRNLLDVQRMKWDGRERRRWARSLEIADDKGVNSHYPWTCCFAPQVPKAVEKGDTFDTELRSSF
jgi:hypothetical protein